jgi:hypothetical protein
LRSGGGKSKGAGFERQVCQQLSQWLSGGARKDLLWRSAMSGGRATLGLRKGEKHLSQGGDVSAIDPLGAVLTAKFCIEIKFYRDLGLGPFWLGYGTLAKFWERAQEDASKYGKEAMLIAKQNQFPTLVIVGTSSRLAFPRCIRWRSYRHNAVVMLFDDMLTISKPGMLLR